ncbi:hypothetical protein [Stieleria varia]|uniref:Uncharacterized protein n=1 Tax=Stieleria varia TaxID=2528005 RepID=A0A5C6B0G6_9BACT|nr:hypothetical protein [Stieleria varia]TWU05795.1 hypothetical protein Pla52n_15100 [Stieleria varia]
MNNPRYDGKPLLRLVELWILWVIGELDSADADRLTEMEPNLRQTWSLGGSWHEMIESLLEIPSAMPDELRSMWQRNAEKARENNLEPPAEMFAQSIADQLTS